ncbi:MAG: acyl-phosphate glycerol 3-phosphate acyltransferase, partial [Gammaproteobacteria bacterium]
FDPGLQGLPFHPAGAPAGDGEVGEIRLRGPCMLSGYYRDTASTDAAMRDGFYHTGDLGFIWEGELYVTGRSKDLIIVGGQNLYPHDIEEALTRFPQIKPGRAAVFSVFDEQLATEELIIAAELRSDADINRTLEKEIRRAVIAQFDVTPRDVRLFAERVLPKSTSGKISRQRCREMYIEGHLGERGKER